MEEEVISLREDIENVGSSETLNEIPRVNSKDLSYDDFVSFMLKNTPVIISLDLTHWDSFNNWFTTGNSLNIEYLKQRIGNVKVPVAKCSEQYFNSHAKVEMNFHDFLDKSWTSDEKLYLKDWHLHNQLPTYKFYKVPSYFASDFLNEYLEDKKEEDYKFVYIGKEGTFTPFHSDVFSSFSWSVNLRGRKKWFILEPGEENKLKDSLGNLPFLITPEMLQENQVKYFTIFQESQEAIFVPSNWFHQVHNEVDTVSINHNWFNACNLDKIWEALKFNLKKVEDEISDCKDMEDFKGHCQVMLKCHFGMNYEGFFDLIEHVARKRCKALRDNENLVIGEGIKFHQSHLKFDVGRIKIVLEDIKKECSGLDLGLEEKCDNILEEIDNL